MKYFRTVTRWFPWSPLEPCQVYMVIQALPIECAQILAITNSEAFAVQQAALFRQAYPTSLIVSGTFRQDESPLQPDRLKVYGCNNRYACCLP